MEKTILLNFKRGDFDILLIDFVDVRFNLLKVGDFVLTLSREAIETGVLQEYPDHEIITSGSKKFFEMWKQGWNLFIDLMKNEGQLKKIVLNKVYGDEETISGDKLKLHTQERNNVLGRLYDIAEHSLPPENIMNFSKNIMISADEHQWGCSPFHYIKDYYEAALAYLEKP
jgi:hypothetical protein